MQLSILLFWKCIECKPHDDFFKTNDESVIYYIHQKNKKENCCEYVTKAAGTTNNRNLSHYWSIPKDQVQQEIKNQKYSYKMAVKETFEILQHQLSHQK